GVPWRLSRVRLFALFSGHLSMDLFAERVGRPHRHATLWGAHRRGYRVPSRQTGGSEGGEEAGKGVRWGGGGRAGVGRVGGVGGVAVVTVLAWRIRLAGPPTSDGAPTSVPRLPLFGPAAYRGRHRRAARSAHHGARRRRVSRTLWSPFRANSRI